jgi:putative transcriptional regulator
MNAKDIKRIRAKLKLSQSQFAELLGIKLKTLQNWEIDRNPPSSAAEALLKAADAGLLTRKGTKR